MLLVEKKWINIYELAQKTLRNMLLLLWFPTSIFCKRKMDARGVWPEIIFVRKLHYRCLRKVNVSWKVLVVKYEPEGCLVSEHGTLQLLRLFTAYCNISVYSLGLLQPRPPPSPGRKFLISPKQYGEFNGSDLFNFLTWYEADTLVRNTPVQVQWIGVFINLMTWHCHKTASSL